MQTMRADLPPLPRRMRGLPVDSRGFPVPFFVATINGVPDHRVLDGAKQRDCIRFRLCALCGEPLGAAVTFVIGPMCAVNRISADPPDHGDCADYAARACPFLARPRAHRRETGRPEGVTEPAGLMLARNPGVALLWTTRRYRVQSYPEGVLWELGPPERLDRYAEGRPATAEELRASFDSGLAILAETAAREGPAAQAALQAQVATARALLALPEEESHGDG